MTSPAYGGVSGVKSLRRRGIPGECSPQPAYGAAATLARSRFGDPSTDRWGQLPSTVAAFREAWAGCAKPGRCATGYRSRSKAAVACNTEAVGTARSVADEDPVEARFFVCPGKLRQELQVGVAIHERRVGGLARIRSPNASPSTHLGRPAPVQRCGATRVYVRDLFGQVSQHRPHRSAGSRRPHRRRRASRAQESQFPAVFLRRRSHCRYLADEAPAAWASRPR